MVLQAEVTTGIQPVDLSNIQQVMDKLLAKGCNAIILTLGPLGAVYASKTNRNVTRIPVTKVHPIDTTVRIAYIWCRKTSRGDFMTNLESIRFNEISYFL